MQSQCNNDKSNDAAILNGRSRQTTIFHNIANDIYGTFRGGMVISRAFCIIRVKRAKMCATLECRPRGKGREKERTREIEIKKKREREGKGRVAARHPIFWSHFTKSRSYFTIPLVARTMRLRAVFHFSPLLLFSFPLLRSLVPSKFVFTRRATNSHDLGNESPFSRTRLFFHFIPFFPFLFSLPKNHALKRGHLSAI